MAEQQEATERTEDPTPKRLDEAVKRGDVAKSQEVNTWFITAGATLILLSFSDKMGSGLQTTLRGFLANAHSITVDGRGLINVTGKLGADILAVLAIPFLILVIAAIAGNMVQHRLVWSSEALMPKLSKVSPGAGFKRLFSKQALVNFAKGLIKVALIGTVMAALLWPQRHRLGGLVTVDPTLILPFTKSLSLSMMGAVVAILAIVAAADYLFQYRVWFERQKMSLRELKEEFKQTEGDPAIKGKIRQIRYARMRKRMMAAVPKASVVITNPTHYAIALKYERGMNAPICLAKGVEAVALKIREVAGKHSIPIVENAPLARALYATVELDKEIPPEHYKAVAEVIGYVMRLRRAVFR
ncbi:MAG: flagellar biosynthesis protein FlhB [Alphaproteobacteria bacterium]|jgi:flagellar biosynthetic protein FlhB|nr:flagellar biosynthesis protein FlhB [Alphaproteobacteria bacterium]